MLPAFVLAIDGNGGCKTPRHAQPQPLRLDSTWYQTVPALRTSLSFRTHRITQHCAGRKSASLLQCAFCEGASARRRLAVSAFPALAIGDAPEGAAEADSTMIS